VILACQRHGHGLGESPQPTPTPTPNPDPDPNPNPNPNQGTRSGSRSSSSCTCPGRPITRAARRRLTLNTLPLLLTPYALRPTPTPAPTPSPNPNRNTLTLIRCKKKKIVNCGAVGFTLDSTDGLAPGSGSLQGVAAQLAPPDRPQLDQRHLRRLRCQVSTRLYWLRRTRRGEGVARSADSRRGRLQKCPRALSAHGTGGTGAHRRRALAARDGSGERQPAHVSSPGFTYSWGTEHVCRVCSS
jgi:hypothetical protein